MSKVFPRVQRKRIHYVKKAKPQDKPELDNVELLAKRMQLSTREIQMYINQSNNV